MPIPDYQTLMLPVLRIAAKGPTRVAAAEEIVAGVFGLTEAEREELLPSGRQRILNNRIHWAKFYMSKAGLVDSPSRGLFVASQAGKDLLTKNPLAINVETLKAYPSFMAFYANSGADGLPGQLEQGVTAQAPQVTPEEQIEAAHVVLHSALKTDLIQRVLAQSPTFFELLIVELLVAMGYGGSHDRAALQLGKSGDGGVDGVIDEDRLGLDRIYVQAKRYGPQVSVGRPEIQGFVGSLVGLGATKGVFVTTSTFSGPAIDYTRHLPQRVILIDGERLADLMIEHNVGVRTSRAVVIKRLDEDFFLEE